MVSYASKMFAADAWVRADWPAASRVHGFTTLRSGPGVSLPPFDRFNLGLRCGDETAHALENRERLRAGFGLPAAPVWLAQVHGAGVARFDGPIEASAPENACEPSKTSLAPALRASSMKIAALPSSITAIHRVSRNFSSNPATFS